MTNELIKLKYNLENNSLDVESLGINKYLLLKEIDTILSIKKAPVREFRDSLGLSLNACPSCGRKF